MTGFVDIHAHVLPGIDDGPADLAESIALARAAAESGSVAIAATPHLRTDFPDVHLHELAGRCQEVREALAREQVPIELASGAEASLSWAMDASDEDLRLATYGQRGTDVLVETPLGAAFALGHLLYELSARGVRVTLAHPERSAEFQRKPEPLEDLVSQGVLLQVNAESLIGRSRRSRTRRLAEYLCTAGLAHVLASDGHRAASWRPVTVLAQGVEALADLIGPERAGWMSTSVPRAILDGRELPEPPPVAPRRRRWFRGKRLA